MSGQAVDNFFDKIKGLADEIRDEVKELSKTFDELVKTADKAPVSYKLAMPESISPKDAARCAIVAQRIGYTSGQTLDEVIIGQLDYDALPANLRQYFVKL
jgi:hypothetical protein